MIHVFPFPPLPAEVEKKTFLLRRRHLKRRGRLLFFPSLSSSSSARGKNPKRKQKNSVFV